MDKDSNSLNQVEVVVPVKAAEPAGAVHRSGVFDQVRKATAWIMIVSAVLFALIGILAVWDVLGNNSSDVIWRAFSSLAIIAFASLIANIASRTVEKTHGH